MKLIILGVGGYGQTVADIAEQSEEYEKKNFSMTVQLRIMLLENVMTMQNIRILQYILLLVIILYDWHGLGNF